MNKTLCRIIDWNDQYVSIEKASVSEVNSNELLYEEFTLPKYFFKNLNDLKLGKCFVLSNDLEIDFSNSEKLEAYFPKTNFVEKYSNSKIFRKQGIKIYKREEIQTVYKRHHDNCNSVVYSEDGGFTWQSVPVDAGKWHIDWIYAFITLE